MTAPAIMLVAAGVLLAIAIRLLTPKPNRRAIACARLAADVEARKAMLAIKPPRGADGRYVRRVV